MQWTSAPWARSFGGGLGWFGFGQVLLQPFEESAGIARGLELLELGLLCLAGDDDLGGAQSCGQGERFAECAGVEGLGLFLAPLIRDEDQVALVVRPPARIE